MTWDETQKAINEAKEADAIRKRILSSESGPWITDWKLPLSPETRDAVELDNDAHLKKWKD